jgi:PAT family beta-lactamase induction signal transducer AmpG
MAFAVRKHSVDGRYLDGMSDSPTGFSVYATRRMAALTGVGFASGLPYVLAGDTLAAWLSDVQIDVTTIGLFSLIGLPYAVKFLWAPLLDRFVPQGLEGLGRRRGWLVVLQGLLAVCLQALAMFGPTQPQSSLMGLAILGTALVLLSASQDIVADAYRTDVLERHELGAGAAVFVAGYRVAMIVGGAFALILPDGRQCSCRC